MVGNIKSPIVVGRKLVIYEHDRIPARGVFPHEDVPCVDVTCFSVWDDDEAAWVVEEDVWVELEIAWAVVLLDLDLPNSIIWRIFSSDFPSCFRSSMVSSFVKSSLS